MVNWKRAGLAVGAVAGVGVGTYALSKMSQGSGSDTSSTSKKSKSKTTESGDDTGEEEVDGTGDDNDDTSSKKKKTEVVEIPIDNYEDALAFANCEWNKIKRDNGHTLECQTIGSTKWRTGEWCKVYMPSFDIDDYMYITITSQSSEGGEWGTNLTLKDYPPGWGKEDLTENTDSEEDEEDADATATGDSSSSDSATSSS